MWRFTVASEVAVVVVTVIRRVEEPRRVVRVEKEPFEVAMVDDEPKEVVKNHWRCTWRRKSN